MRAKFWTSVIAAMLIGMPLMQPAVGQSIDLGPDGLQVRPREFMPDRRPAPREELEEEISEDEAVSIARRAGMRRVEREREGRRGWVLVGIDRNGDDLRIIIGRDGEVIDIQRE